MILIDMDMPNSCFDCDLHNYHFCNLTNTEIGNHYWNGGKPSDCPLKLADKNTVSEQTYTDEFNARKEAEFELYKLRRNIDDMLAEIKGLAVQDVGEAFIKNNCIRIIEKYIKEQTDEK